MGPAHEGPPDGQHLLLAARQRAAILAPAFLQDGEEAEDPVEILVADCPGAGRRPSPGSPCTLHAREDAPAFGYVADAQGYHLMGGQVADLHPSKRMVPLDGWTKPEMVRSVVVLPAPLAPSSATISPSST